MTRRAFDACHSAWLLLVCVLALHSCALYTLATYRGVEPAVLEPGAAPAAAPSHTGHSVRSLAAAAVQHLHDLVGARMAAPPSAEAYQPPPPPQSGSMEAPADASHTATDANGLPVGGDSQGDSKHPWPVVSPFLSKDPAVPTVWGNKDRDGVDPNDPFCKWKDGMMFCI